MVELIQGFDQYKAEYASEIWKFRWINFKYKMSLY